MSWGSETWLWGLLGLAPLIALLGWAAGRHYRKLRATLHPDLLDRVLPGEIRRRRALRAALVLLGLAGTIVALAEPRVGEEVHQVEAEGVDLVIALDLSRSMDAQDVSPSRLKRAKRTVHDLVEILEGDRVGLVLFAGVAHSRLPLTRDLPLLQQVVDKAHTGMFEAQGTALDDAIRHGVRMLQGTERPAGKAILVLSDGEVHRAADALAAARHAAEAGIRIYSLGIGEEPAPIPRGSGGWLLDERGRTVMSEPSEQVLTEIGRLTGGAYARSVPSNEDVLHIYRGEMRRALEAGEGATVQHRSYHSAFPWFLWPSLLLLLGAAWMGDGRQRWPSVGLLLLLPQLAEAGDLAEADALYRQGDYARAEQILSELSLERPGDAEILDRLAAARMRAGDAEGAAQAYDDLIDIGGPQAPTIYNSGNAHWEAGRLEEALARYEAVLEEHPEHEAARHNRDLLLEELEVRAAAEPPPPPPPEEGESQGEDEGEEEPADGDTEGTPEDAEGPEDGPEDGTEDGPQPDVADADVEDREPGRDGTDADDGVAHGYREAETPDLEDVQGEHEDGEVPEAEGAETEGMTPDEARRLLEGVEEAEPTLRVPPDERPGERPW